MLYHISRTGGLKVLKPQVSTHEKAYVYALENPVTGLLFGASHDDFDFIIDEEGGVPSITECYPGALSSIFEGKTCSIYQVSREGFMEGMTSWSPELVCENQVNVISETPVKDLYLRLLEEEKRGSLVIHRYENTPEHKKLVSEHIVDRLIRFDALYSDDPRLKKHYGRLMAALIDIMDGHLL